MPLVDIADYVDGFTELKALCGYGFHKTHDPVVSGMFGLAEQQPVSYPLALNGLGCGGDCACAKCKGVSGLGDRLGEAAMLTAIGLVFMRDGNEIALVATFAAVIGSFLVSYARAKAEALGLRGDVGFGSRVERVVLISIGLGLAPWGWLQWPVYLLAAMTWLTVVQRILFVRRQLRELAETGT
jgi:hypothetical protein